MNNESGINPAQGVTINMQSVDYETEGINHNGVRPPPYSPNLVTCQPVMHQTIIVQPPPLKDGPIYYNCPACQERVITDVKYVSTEKTHMCAGFIFGFTFWCCLCCLGAIPYLINTCKKSEHYCPNCKTHLGTYSRV